MQQARNNLEIVKSSKIIWSDWLSTFLASLTAWMVLGPATDLSNPSLREVVNLTPNNVLLHEKKQQL